MIITTRSTTPAVVQVSSEPDGVNPPDVFELTVDPIGGRPNAAPRYRVELRVGDAMEFAAHEDDAPSYPETVLDAVFQSGQHHEDCSLDAAFARAAGDLAALYERVRDHRETSADTLGTWDRMLDAFDALHSDVRSNDDE